VISSALNLAGISGGDVARAQEDANKLLTYNSAVPGKIDDTTFDDSWHIHSKGKERISISVERTDGTLVPTLTLRDQQNNIVAKADHDPTFAKATIASLVFPTVGEFTVTVGRINGKNGKTTGGYKLLATRLGAAVQTGKPFVQGELKLGTPLKGTLMAASWTDTWLLNLDSTASVTLIITRKSGTLVPVIAVTDADNKPLVNADPDETFAAASITSFTPPLAGAYLVTVARVDGINGATSGDYELTATR
jgi:hypothetical protein